MSDAENQPPYPPAVPPFAGAPTADPAQGAYLYPPTGDPSAPPVPGAYPAYGRDTAYGQGTVHGQDAAYGPYGGAYAPVPEPKRPPLLGRIALLLSLVALVGGAIVIAVALVPIGAELGAASPSRIESMVSLADYSLLWPVRDAVLTAEIAFWTATALGLWSLVQGIVAIATRRGRGPGIAAVVVSVLAPAVVGGVAFIGFLAGVGIGIDRMV